VRARRVLLATSAFRALLQAIRRYVVPVYDYALVTEPLNAALRGAIGWRRRQGLSGGANRFHYSPLSSDGRILFGGYDAVYRFRGPSTPPSTTMTARSRGCRRTSSTRGDVPALRPHAAGAVPARAVALGRRAAHAQPAGGRDGRRGAWLQTLDRLGLGFDS
jgi:hypothetical protein